MRRSERANGACLWGAHAKQVMRFLPVLGVLFVLGCNDSDSASVLDRGGDGGGGNVGSGLTLELAWDPVTTNDDGSSADDVAGYRVYDGQVSGSYDAATDVGDLTEVVLQDLEPGTYFVTVTAYDYFGNESSDSGEIVAEVGP